MNVRHLIQTILLVASLAMAACATPIHPQSGDPPYDPWSDAGMPMSADSATGQHDLSSTPAEDSGGPIADAQTFGDAAADAATTDGLAGDAADDLALLDGLGKSDDLAFSSEDL